MIKNFYIEKFPKKNIFNNLKKIKKDLKKNKIVIIKNYYNTNFCDKIKKYLSIIGKNTIPNYQNISLNCPNFYRINFEDKRSIVKGFFHQFSFFPWNNDQLDFFKDFGEVFELKNLLTELPSKKFFNPKNNNDCTIRLSFQFYPKSKGYLNPHSDPVSYHQKHLVQLCLTNLNKDFRKGGLYVILKKKKIYLDKYTSTGDLILFNADTTHGVETIDPKVKYKPLNFKGRWMVIFSTNKLLNNKIIKNSKQKKG